MKTHSVVTVGVLKEVKKSEGRVALTPSGAQTLVQDGCVVLVETNAGAAAGFTDAEYTAHGARISDKETVWKADLVLHVKEPQPQEFEFLQGPKVPRALFTYLHLASNPELAAVLTNAKSKGLNAFAYENVSPSPGLFPLLLPMSEVAGRMAVIEGAKYIQHHFGGKGKLICGVPGAEPAHVLILGAGVVGTNAAKLASSLGARTTVLDLDSNKLRALSALLPTVATAICSKSKITELLPSADIVIGAILQPNAATPKLVTEDMLTLMEKGSVLVDVAIDQGGCFQTSKPTTHTDPVFIHKGIVHYCVANMPGAVTRTSTIALTNATLPYIQELTRFLRGDQDMLSNALNAAYIQT
jgi:alanine dehydrogenase